MPSFTSEEHAEKYANTPQHALRPGHRGVADGPWGGTATPQMLHFNQGTRVAGSKLSECTPLKTPCILLVLPGTQVTVSISATFTSTRPEAEFQHSERKGCMLQRKGGGPTDQLLSLWWWE